MNTEHDCVYYYTGGNAKGQWHQAAAGTKEDCLKLGYPAVNGSTKIGPPDGYPSATLRREVNRVCGTMLWLEAE